MLGALGAVVLLAFTVETALGFGSTVVAIALGSHFAPIDVILPAFVPLNVALSLYLAARHHADIDRRLLLARIVPLMGLGLPVGILLFRHLGTGRLQLTFGVFVMLLSVLELRRMGRAESRAPGPIVSSVLLFVAGIIHGVFATGGPLAVYVTGRALADKARFRATLSALWLLLNLALVFSYALSGQIGRGSLSTSAALSIPLFLGLLLGERVHRAVPEKLFRTLVFALLLVAGGLLCLR